MSLTLHPMKEIRVIVAGEHRSFVTDLLDRVNATGYTIIGNVSGKGHHGATEMRPEQWNSGVWAIVIAREATQSPCRRIPTS